MSYCPADTSALPFVHSLFIGLLYLNLYFVVKKGRLSSPMSSGKKREIIKTIIQGLRKIGKRERQKRDVQNEEMDKKEVNAYDENVGGDKVELSSGGEKNNGVIMCAGGNDAKHVTAIGDDSSCVSSARATSHTVSFHANNRSIRMCSYKSNIFNEIRCLRKVGDLFTRDDYIYSSDLVGKSGSVLFFSPDFNFLVKTIRKHEKNTLLSLIPNYIEHIKKYDTTFLSIYYGCYKIVIERTQIYFIIMNNFLPPRNVHQLYDLKGSFYKRMGTSNDSTVLKDLDWRRNKKRVYIEDRVEMIEQIEKDAVFLEENQIMDYSLLLGVTGTGKEAFSDGSYDGSYSDASGTSTFSPDRRGVRSDVSWINLHNERSDRKKGIVYHYITENSENTEIDGLFDTENRLIRGYSADVSGIKEVYFIGIIDLLTKWSWRKALEYHFNRLFCKKEFSSVNPKAYKERFITMVRKRIFHEKDNMTIE